MQHKCKIIDAILQFMHLTSAGSFKAARSKVPRRSARAPAAPSVPRARSANAATLVLVGAEFEESLMSWEVAVWYYDVAMAADLELDEGEVNLARKTGVDLAPLEFSSTCEVRRWMKASTSARE
jgi:hypothetical protein